MKRIKIGWIVIFISFFLLISSSIGGYWLIKKPNILLGQSAKLLIIPSGIHFCALQDSLYQGGYVQDTISFGLLARLTKYPHKVIAGAYQLKPHMGNWQAIKLLRSGSQVPIKLVLDHVYTQSGLIAKITQNTSIKANELQQLFNDTTFIGQLGFNADNILAMFIPNTYEIYWRITPEALFQRMQLEYQRFWHPERMQQANQLGLSPIEVVILASIIQKETNKIQEAPIIAGVYLNRLKKGMHLQACPTLLYIADDPSARRVLHKYRHIDSRYNTYLYKGLPPGPISIPCIAMIEAVLNCQQHNYLYFSAKEDFSGYHYFAKTFREHKKNGAQYRKALNRANVYK